MTPIEEGDAIAAAQQQIDAILNALERALGRPVLSMHLATTDITTMQDVGRRALRNTLIDVAPPPGLIGKV